MLLLTLLLPAGLLLLMLAMERVEEPLRARDTTRTVRDFLDNARPDELEQMITEGLDTVVGRYWRRRRLTLRTDRRLVRRQAETTTTLTTADPVENTAEITGLAS